MRQKHDLLSDDYFLRYAFGMFDALTTTLGLEIRQKAGRGLIEMWVVGYMTVEFQLEEGQVRRLLDKLFELYNKEGSRDAAIMDGGSDGVTRLQGGQTTPRRRASTCTNTRISEISRARSLCIIAENLVVCPILTVSKISRGIARLLEHFGVDLTNKSRNFNLW